MLQDDVWDVEKVTVALPDSVWDTEEVRVSLFDNIRDPIAVVVLEDL